MPAAHDPLALPAVPPPAPASHPRRDAWLVGLFVAALIAFATIDPFKGKALHVENRSPAAWPAAPFGIDTPARFDAAFSDRFRARNALIALEHAIVVLGFRTSPGGNVVLGREDWLYFAGEDGRAIDRHVRGTLPFPDAQVAGLAREIERRRAWLAARGIAYVVMVAPDKATIYPEHLPAWMKPMAGPTPLERATRALQANADLRYVDVRALLRAAKTRAPVYYRTDSHWNYLGAIVAYGALMDQVQQAVGRERLPSIAPPDVPAYVPGVDVYRGDLARLLGVSHYDEPDVAPFGKVLGNAPHRCARRIDGGHDEGFEVYACDRAPDVRAVVYRDSMAIPLIPLLSENFRRVVYVSSQRLDPALIEREHPDVVIEEFVERNLQVPAENPMP